MDEIKKQKTLLISCRQIGGYTKDDYEGGSIVKISSPPSTYKSRTYVSDIVEKMQPDDVIFYLSQGSRSSDMRTGYELKSLASQGHTFDITMGACSCEYQSAMKDASDLDIYYMFTDCSGRGMLGKIVSDLVSEKPEFWWKDYSEEKILSYLREGTYWLGRRMKAKTWMELKSQRQSGEIEKYLDSWRKAKAEGRL